MARSTLSLSCLISICLLMSACSSRAFIGNPAIKYQDYSCFIEEDICGLEYEDNGYIVYKVIDLGENKYRVLGKVDINFTHSGSKQFLIFYVLFMDNNEVVYERRIKTHGTKQDIDFEFQTEKPIHTSTLEKVRFMVMT